MAAKVITEARATNNSTVCTERVGDWRWREEGAEREKCRLESDFKKGERLYNYDSSDKDGWEFYITIINGGTTPVFNLVASVRYNFDQIEEFSKASSNVNFDEKMTQKEIKETLNDKKENSNLSADKYAQTASVNFLEKDIVNYTLIKDSKNIDRASVIMPGNEYKLSLPQSSSQLFRYFFIKVFPRRLKNESEVGDTPQVMIDLSFQDYKREIKNETFTMTINDFDFNFSKDPRLSFKIIEKSSIN